MKIGVHIFATDQTVGVAELAREVEDRGFESLWLPEHTHIPTNRESEWYRGQELPAEYSRTLDQFVALTVAAVSTTRLVVGSGICLVAQHDPILTAKAVATLDHVAAGRFLFGVGLGWNLEEMRDHGVDPAKRRSHARETVQAMQGIWSNERFGFDGDYVAFSESWCWPKPVQSPWPPVLVGGRAAPQAFKDIALYGDGWMPDVNMFRLDRLPGFVTELSEACAARGRGPVPVSALGVRPGDERLEQLAGMDLERLVFVLPSADRTTVFHALDEISTGLESMGLGVEPAS